MKTFNFMGFILFASTLLPSTALATTINIPADYPTIQQGIDVSSNGDTVLVQPGTYVENINFNRHSIVLASFYLMTEDTSYISTTIIDGDSSGTVITLESGEDNTTMIVGFTIRNGANPFGGGIYCLDASNPIIRHNIIENNVTTSYWGEGAGIRCLEASPVIEFNVIRQNRCDMLIGHGGGIALTNTGCTVNGNLITDNRAAEGGGVFQVGNVVITENIISNNMGNFGAGMLCEGGDILVMNNTISGNSGDAGAGLACGYGQITVKDNVIISNRANYGGGIYYLVAEIEIDGNTIVGNYADLGGAIYASMQSENATLRNCILWNESSDEIYSDVYGGYPTVSYCDIRGGWEGEGNMDCDPMFCSPEYDDYHLHTSSCCVGAGENGVDIGALGVGCGLIPCGSYIIGDFNGSGDFNVADIVSSYSRLATGSPNPALQCECPPGSGLELAAAMDVNNTCVFNVADVVVAYQRLSFGQPEFQPCQYCPPAGR